MLGRKALFTLLFSPFVLYSGIDLAGTVGFSLQFENHTESWLTYSLTNEKTDSSLNAENTSHDIAGQASYPAQIGTTQTIITIADKKNGKDIRKEQIDCAPSAFCSTAITLNHSSPYCIQSTVYDSQHVIVAVWPENHC